MSSVVGWDIGGVHLKAARAEGGRIVKAIQIASPLRSGLEPLIQAFAQAKAELGGAQRHVVTMTGELADTFSSRPEGVERLALLAAHELAGTPVSIYAGPAGYICPPRARAYVGEIASANWHACAALVARHRSDALFIDMGSTTTDVVPVIGGEIAARGYTDVQRLAAGELVYTGLVRGFVMATADRAPFNGLWTPLINENFANMADVHRILEDLPAGADQMATTDGREKTLEASRARLARMIGADAADADNASWLALARWFAEMQMRAVIDAIMLVGSHCHPPPHAPIVGAGVGTHVVEEIARRIGRTYVGFDELLEVAPQARTDATRCAPAAALALLCS
jgi:probable H4MPT-linked C1 transfer pathway protein